MSRNIRAQHRPARPVKDCGVFRPIIKEVGERSRGCGNPRFGFAREVLAGLVRKEVPSPEWTEGILF